MKWVTRWITSRQERLHFFARTASGEQEVDFANAVLALRRFVAPDRYLQSCKKVYEKRVGLGSSRSGMDPLDTPPDTLLTLLEAGDQWWQYALCVEQLFVTELTAEQQRMCFATGVPAPLLPKPPSFRDFYAFEAHVKQARARRGLGMQPEWYQAPVFYFSNAAAFIGDGMAVERPRGCSWLDYELEVATIIRKSVRDVSPLEWLDVTAGLTILNDWSARDIQVQEMKVGLGPAKGKDFATSLGPVLVTWDELQDCKVILDNQQGPNFNLKMRAYVNEILRSQGNLADLYFTFGQMIARASEGVTLYPGDVIGSGTVGSGCILEIGPEQQPWLEAGDVVTLEVERIGRLTNVIA
ncbi:fumarylacetoacetate hydrolase family protein [Sulfoacidibacillus thermotolerans]|uniref:Fumarylacetoacetase-like C-terminal domain-containing protein n=1 Tax=Sulfoacidibacillus thermotolerans TaxID=1765684 RepID=A0A2U3DCF9_SULT2|nr:fumarylacetoacetate hydrolase family protein [Sulfoacidibacillus thermotolerans]PWI58970.1 hypothetical protein BM613_02545 [Sulfoacidibacillus thermotolerans]